MLVTKQKEFYQPEKEKKKKLYLKMYKYMTKMQSRKTCDSSHQWTENKYDDTNQNLRSSTYWCRG